MRTRCAAILMGCLVAGCEVVNDPAESAPSFSVQVSGDTAVTLAGHAFTYAIQNGYAVVDPQTGARTQSDVTSVLLLPSHLLSPVRASSVHLGLLGKAVVGTYQLRSGDALGSGNSFYASYDVPLADGGRLSYDASNGTVVISQTTPKLAGTFSFESKSAVQWPADPPIGTTVRSRAAALMVSGSFVADPINPTRIVSVR